MPNDEKITLNVINPISHARGGTKLTTRFKAAERRLQVAQIFRDNPGITQDKVAKMLSVNRGTISRDLKAITEEIRFQTSNDYLIHHDRVLHEIQEKKKICEDRLARLEGQAHQGARWMEEWTKLAQLEVRILGLNAPEKMLVKQIEDISKDERDSAINAILECATDIIDITPKKINEEHTTEA